MRSWVLVSRGWLLAVWGNGFGALNSFNFPPFPFNLSALELIAAIEGSGYELFIDLANKPAIAPRY